ncbi:acylphosphatase [Microbaculum marinum]|uniref:Acylphosphatase n=1 Tax=Microbaculum marinum TaxID=1764581 RepID=A0AAW9RM82_9HYPH
MKQQTVHVRIEGRVQGVYFRAWTVENARRLNLNGWVQNRRDGDVEAVFSGDQEAVATMLGLCEDGPRDAVVTSVRIVSEGGAAPDGFSVRPTL